MASNPHPNIKAPTILKPKPKGEIIIYSRAANAIKIPATQALIISNKLNQLQSKNSISKI